MLGPRLTTRKLADIPLHHSSRMNTQQAQAPKRSIEINHPAFEKLFLLISSTINERPPQPNSRDAVFSNSFYMVIIIIILVAIKAHANCRTAQTKKTTNKTPKESPLPLFPSSRSS
jgi:hypothetical protein